MDKNTIIGVSLIAVVLIGFTFLNRPTPEEATPKEPIEATSPAPAETTSSSVVSPTSTDSLAPETSPLLGLSGGQEQIIKLENEKLVVSFSNHGGAAVQARLKE